MDDQLENLVQRADEDISARSKKPVVERSARQLPKFSIAAGVWLVFLVLVITQFETMTSFVDVPVEAKIERDLEDVLNTTAASLAHYQTANGVLPHLLPNPAIRGLVKYERQSDYDYTLTATISGVTMRKTSSKMHPYRVGLQ